MPPPYGSIASTGLATSARTAARTAASRWGAMRRGAPQSTCGSGSLIDHVSPTTAVSRPFIAPYVKLATTVSAANTSI